MSRVRANGIELEVDARGGADRPAILLIMGLGLGLAAWPDAFVDGLVARGFRVVRFDNRDCGRSTYIDAEPPPAVTPLMLRAFFGWPVPAPYTLDDMAADTAGLLDALTIERAHVVGASLGGMVAQRLAIGWPQRVASLVPIMSTSGSRRVLPPRPDALLALLRRPPRTATLPQLVDHFVYLFRVIGSPGFPTPEPVLRQRLEKALAHGYRPDGTLRQFIAVLASGDCSLDLPAITAPTLVIHGDADPLVPLAGGEDVAAKIPGAELKVIHGMGHDLAPGLLPLLVDAIAAHCARHTAGRSNARSRAKLRAAG